MTEPPKEIARRLRVIGVSGCYAWQIAHGKRTPSLKMALEIHRKLGLKFGALSDASDREIKTLDRVVTRDEAAA